MSGKYAAEQEYILTTERAGVVGYAVSYKDATRETMANLVNRLKNEVVVFGDPAKWGHVDLREGPNDEFLKHPELLPKAQRDRIDEVNREWEEILRERARAAAAEATD